MMQRVPELQLISLLSFLSFYPRPSLPTLEVAPVQIVEVLSTAPDWSFDIFKLEEQTERRFEHSESRIIMKLNLVFLACNN